MGWSVDSFVLKGRGFSPSGRSNPLSSGETTSSLRVVILSDERSEESKDPYTIDAVWVV